MRNALLLEARRRGIHTEGAEAGALAPARSLQSRLFLGVKMEKPLMI